MRFIRKLYGVAASVALAAAAVVSVGPAAFAAPPGYFQIWNQGSYFCAAVEGNSRDNAAKILHKDCKREDGFYWRWGQASRGENPRWLINLGSQKCMWPNAGHVQDVQYVEQRDCMNRTGMQWQLFPDAHANILRVFDSGYALSVHQPVGEENSRIMLYHFNGHRSPDQYWVFWCDDGVEPCP